jgi:diguanylate cyclase (GGDEF)-like protein
MPIAYAKYRVIYDEAGQPYDSLIIDSNAAYADLLHTKPEALTGKSLSETMPKSIRQSGGTNDYEKIMTSQEPLRFTRHNDEKNKHFQVSAFSDSENTFVTLIEDISEHIINTLKLIEANTSLIENNRKLYKDSVTDSLTRFYNHSYIRQVLREEIDLAEYKDRALSIAMIDIDHFKKINDSYGHQTGDRVLSMLSDLIRTHTRREDHIGRYGGEEFLLILPNSDAFQASAIVDRIRLAIEHHRFDIDASNLSLTVSCGIASYSGQALHQFIDEADKHLYTAKRLGRNQCICNQSV